MRQKISVYRLNGQYDVELEGSGEDVRNKAISQAKSGVEFRKPDVKLIAENIPKGVDVPSPQDILVEIRHAVECWYSSEDKELLKTLQRVEGMIELLGEVHY